MNFELISFGGTLAIGFAGVLLLWTNLHLLGVRVPRPTKVLVEKNIAAMAVVSIMSIAMGICIESTSDALADDSMPYRLIWGSDHEHKVGVLFRQDEGAWQPTLLGQQVAAAGCFAREVPDKAKRAAALEVQDAVHAHRDLRVVSVGSKQHPGFQPSVGEPLAMIDLVRPAYYAAKATVMRVSGHLDELTRIQQRLDFGRSLYLLGLLGSILAIAAIFGLRAVLVPYCLLEFFALGLLPLLLVVGYSVELGRDPAWRLYVRGLAPEVTPARKWRRQRFLRLLATSAAMLVMGGMVYSHQEEEYDKRVFGYHLGLMRDAGVDTLASAPTSQTLQGISGLTRLVDDEFLAVLDTKGENQRARFVVVQLAPTGLDVGAVEWVDSICDPAPSDLESIVHVSGSTYLACESWSFSDPSSGRTRPHRLLELDVRRHRSWRVAVVRQVELVWPEETRVNIEAMVYHQGRVYLFDRGEGGDVRYHDLHWPPPYSKVSPVERGRWRVLAEPVPKAWRGCSDLALVGDTMFGLATSDADTPYGSLATWSFQVPVTALAEAAGPRQIMAQPLWDGLKGEALSRTRDGRWLVGSDDEEFGGAVRLVSELATPRRR